MAAQKLINEAAGRFPSALLFESIMGQHKANAIRCEDDEDAD
jgi:hypothetical protein